MQLGMIGLGRMGANMVCRLIKGGHSCVVFDLIREIDRGAGDSGGRRRHVARRFREEARQAPRARLADDPPYDFVYSTISELTDQSTKPTTSLSTAATPTTSTISIGPRTSARGPGPR